MPKGLYCLVMARILLVEDDDFISAVLEKRLRENYDVVVAKSTKDADAALAAGPVDLVLLDIVMPDEDGFAWLTRVKADGSQYRSIPVIILSNLDQREDVERGIKLGAQEYLVKGYMLPEEVVQKIEAQLKP
jgi:DNA-binding response OmpR family regulator